MVKIIDMELIYEINIIAAIIVFACIICVGFLSYKMGFNAGVAESFKVINKMNKSCKQNTAGENKKYSVEYIMANLQTELNRYGDIVTVKISLDEEFVYFDQVSLNEISCKLNSQKELNNLKRKS
jgi:hypothetical protein